MWPFRQKREDASTEERIALGVRAELAKRDELQQVQRAAHQKGIADAMSLMIDNKDNRPVHFNNPWFFNQMAPVGRRPESTVTYQTLRAFADNYDILRDCIEHLKREARAVPIRIVAKDPSDDSERTLKDIEEASFFFTRRGGLGGLSRQRRHFESEIIEDALVLGNYSAWFNETVGGQLLEVVSIDAATIRPLVDESGWMHPERSYEQQVSGVPIAVFSDSDIAFDGFHAVSNTPYFKSRVEWLITVVIAALKTNEWNLSWLTDGRTPDLFISFPKEWTPSMVSEFEAYFDLMLAGNGEARDRRKPRFVPEGTNPIWSQSRKDADFSVWERWLMERTCAMMGVHPTAIGFSSDTYKFSQETGNKSTSQFGANDVLLLRKDLYDEILERLGFPHLEIKNVVEGEEEPMDRAKRLQIEIGKPIKTINEGRQEIGLQPVDGGDDLIQEPEEPEGDPKLAKSKADDAKRWRRKALSRLKDGKPAFCAFESTFFTSEELINLSKSLMTCDRAEDVRALFAPFEETT